MMISIWVTLDSAKMEAISLHYLSEPCSLEDGGWGVGGVNKDANFIHLNFPEELSL